MQPMIGQISLFPYGFAPRDYLVCDGRLVPIAENEMLFNLLSTTFGGDGMSTFAIPDLSAKAPEKCEYCIAYNGTFGDGYQEFVVGETFPLPNMAPAPRNTAECKGQSFTKNQNAALQHYMKNRFGGDGVNTFNLPNLKAPVDGYRYLITLQGAGPEVPTARQPMVGELILLPYDQALRGLLRCDGSRVSAQTYSGLAGVIGTRFGGTADQFALPDLRSIVPTNYSYYIAPTGSLPSRG